MMQSPLKPLLHNSADAIRSCTADNHRGGNLAWLWAPPIPNPEHAGKGFATLKTRGHQGLDLR